MTKNIKDINTNKKKKKPKKKKKKKKKTLNVWLYLQNYNIEQPWEIFEKSFK